MDMVKATTTCRVDASKEVMIHIGVVVPLTSISLSILERNMREACWIWKVHQRCFRGREESTMPSQMRIMMAFTKLPCIHGGVGE